MHATETGGEDDFFLSLCMHMYMQALCACTRAYACLLSCFELHTPQSTLPPPAIIQYLRAYTHPSQSTPTHSSSPAWSEEVDCEVLHNRIDPLTSRGHYTKSPPLHLPDVDIIYNIMRLKQSEA